MIEPAENGEPPTEWIVYCESHRHYLVRATSGGTTWTDEQAKAQRHTTKRAALVAVKSATWLDHKPGPWAVAGTSTPPGGADA